MLRNISATLLFILLLLLSVNGYSQCKYVWQKLTFDGNGTGDTIVNTDPFYTGAIDTSYTIDFGAIIRQIKNPRLPLHIQQRLQHDIDSLSGLSADSFQREIEFRQYELESVFQVISVDNVEYVLYDIDTFNGNNLKIPVYKLSTSFYKEWNEDFNNYMLYYTTEFGLLRSDYIPIWDYVDDTPSHSLIKHCNMSAQDIRTKDSILTFINGNRF